MRYDQKQFTQQGLNLFTNALSQKQSITIDKVIMDNLPTSNLSNLALLTLDDFANAQSFSANYTKVDNNMLTVDSVISNQGFTNSYSANEVGLVGHTEGSNDETLIAILVASDPFILPAQQNDETPLHLIPNVTIQLANNDMGQVPVDTAQDAYVPQNRLDELVSQHNYVKLTDADSRYVKQDDFNHEVNDAVNNKADKSDLSNLQSSVNESIEPKLDAKANQSDLESTNDTIKSLDITNQDGKLMHAGKPLLTANAPNAPSLSLSIDSNNNNVQYTITPPSIDGGASITNYTLMYQAQGDNGWQTRTLDTSSLVGEFPATQSQTYNVQVSANNYAGSSVTNNMQTILTASTPTITSINASASYPDNINISLSVNNNGSNITDVIVYYQASGNNNWQTMDLGNSLTGSFTGNDNTEYNIKAKVANAVGYSNDSDTINATTMRGYYILSSPTAFIGSTTGIVSQNGDIANMNAPYFALPFNITNISLEVGFRNYMYKNGSTVTGNNYIPTMPEITLDKSQIQVGNKLNISNMAGATMGQYLSLYISSNNVLEILNYNNSNTDSVVYNGNAGGTYVLVITYIKIQ